MRSTALRSFFVSCALPFLALHGAKGDHVPAAPVPSHAPAVPLRIILVVDNSWSMAHRVGAAARVDYAVSAAERWAARLPVPSSVTVQVVTASDRVDVVGAFALQSEGDRAALIDAIRGIRPVRSSRTHFAAIDAGLAEIVRRDTAAGEDFALIFVTDAISDTPESDLRADEIGDRTMTIGGGVSAVLLGTVPGSHLLARRGAPTSLTSSSRSGGKQTSALRALRRGLIRLDGSEAIVGTMPARLFGGWRPLRTDVRVDNAAGVARLVRFDAAAPRGLSAIVSPNPLVVPAGGAGTATIELSAPEVLQGQVTVIAQLPDGRSAQHTMYVQLTPGSWAAGNLWLITLCVILTVLTLSMFVRWMRRTVRVGDHADADRQAALRVGDSVALDVFAAGATGTLRRGWFGYHILADGEPIAVSGRSIPAGGRGHYRLGEDIRAADRTFAIYRTDAAVPAMSAGDLSFALSGGRSSGGLR